jgi:carbon storage regulator
MLVLTRRLGEEIVIDGNVRLTVVAVQGGRVKLGVAAPASVRVHREEIQSLKGSPGRNALPDPLREVSRV